MIPLLFLAACSSDSSPKNYTFELTDKLLSSELSKEDSKSTYSNSCNRKIELTWEVKVDPPNFTGFVVANGIGSWGKGFDSEEAENWIRIIDGKMTKYYDSNYVYSTQDDTKEYKFICSFSDPKKYSLKLDYETLIMLPGVQPAVLSAASESK